jgi:hypothetical protein
MVSYRNAPPKSLVEGRGKGKSVTPNERISKSLTEITDDIEREGDAKRTLQDPERAPSCKVDRETGAEGRGGGEAQGAR